MATIGRSIRQAAAADAAEARDDGRMLRERLVARVARRDPAVTAWQIRFEEAASTDVEAMCAVLAERETVLAQARERAAAMEIEDLAAAAGCDEAQQRWLVHEYHRRAGTTPRGSQR
jgi:hypothetical protein